LSETIYADYTPVGDLLALLDSVNATIDNAVLAKDRLLTAASSVSFMEVGVRW
jgi:hypothetical protein